MKTKETLHPELDKTLKEHKKEVLKLMYHSLDGNQILNDSHVLYKDIPTPLKNDMFFLNQIYKLAVKSKPQQLNYDTFFGNELNKHLDKDYEFDRHSKALFLKEYLNIYQKTMSKEDFVNHFEKYLT